MAEHQRGRMSRPKTHQKDPSERRDWGSVARKGASSVKREGAPGRQPETDRAAPDKRFETWNREIPAPRKKQPKERTARKLSEEAVSELERACGRNAPRAIRYMAAAIDSFSAERWVEAKKSLRVPLEMAPSAVCVKELNALVMYKLGKWKEAFESLSEVHLATHSFDYYPAMMDCQRALKHKGVVDELWAELREASPGAEVMAEGRIVQAGRLADEGRFVDAIRLLEKAPKAKGDVRAHHLRTWYALGDLHDRSGDQTSARRMFEAVSAKDPDFADVFERLDSLE